MARTLTTDELLEHTSWIRSLARHLLGDAAEADDAVQETWLAALRSPPPDDRPLRPWLVRVLRNAVLQRRRGDSSRARREQHAARPEGLPSVDELVERAEIHRRLVADVIALDEPYRSTVLLRYFEDLAPAEIAKRKGLPAATVRSHLARGLERLRARQDARAGGDGRAWLAALLPLAHPDLWTGSGAAWTAGALRGWTIVKGLKATAAVLAVLVAGIVSYRVWRSSGPAERGLAAADARAEPAALDAVDPHEHEQVPAGVLSTPEVAEPGARVALGAPGAQSHETVAPELGLPVRGRVLDMETGEPLPFYALDVSGPAEHAERVESDAGGRFTAAPPPVPGELDFEPVDHPGVPPFGVTQSHDYDPSLASADELVLRVQTGPTYRLRLRTPIELEAGDLTATLISASQRFTAEERSDWVNRSVVRASASGELWVRFGALASQTVTAVGGPFLLIVRTRDGLLSGSAEVDSARGVYPDRVAVVMESAGSVAGLVSSAQGEPLSDALVVLGRARADGSMEWQRRVRTDADGTYALGGVEPGAYQVRASESSHAPETVDLNVPRRSETRRDFQLDPLPIAGDVSGAIRSRTGTYRNPILLWLHGEGSRRDGTVKWEREGVEWVGRFSFEDLPHGEYTLFAQAMLGEKMEPASVRVTPPDSSVALTVLDQAQPDPIAFTVIDAATREPLPSFEVRLWNDETMGFYVTLPSVHQNERLGTLLPEGSSWMVRVGGYQLASGDDADLLPAEIDGEPVRMAHLELEAGWGARFLVKGPDGPLEGATLFLDGIERATTDERGFAIGNAPAKPATAAVLYRDWVVTGGAVDPVTGALAEGGLATVIELAPPR